MFLLRMDLRLIFVVLCIQMLSLVTISSFSSDLSLEDTRPFFHPLVVSQLRWIVLGWLCFYIVARWDYTYLRNWTWLIYSISCIALIGLFFTDHIARVQRWYKIAGISIQPSELAKLAVVITISWFLEFRIYCLHRLSTIAGVLAIAGVPFFLIVRQPDLGTAMILYPITLVMMYFGGIRPWVVKVCCVPACIALGLLAVTFSGAIPYESLRPLVAGSLKEYQYEQ